MRLTSSEKNLARIAGLAAGILAVLSILWVSRPVAKDPTMGTDLSVRIQPMDGIDIASNGATVIDTPDLQVGDPPVRGVARLASVHPYQSKVRWQVFGPATDEVAGNPAAGLVWLSIGSEGEFGQAPVSAFASGAMQSDWLPSGRFDVPVTAWIPGTASGSAAALELDLTLVPEIVGERP